LSLTPTILIDCVVLARSYFSFPTRRSSHLGPGGFSYTQTDSVNGNGTYTAGTTLGTMGQVAGTYTWSAHYSGDGNNISANDQGDTGRQPIGSAANPKAPMTATANINHGTTA